MNNKRLTYLDLAKGLGIILVVFGHLEYINENVRGYISAFHMPLFFVISGILIALGDETRLDFKTMASKKARGLLIPYIWFSLLYIPIDVMNVCIHHIDMNTFIFNIISSCIFSGVGVLWFLPALFIAEIGAYLLIKKIKKSYIVIPVSVLLSILLYILVDLFVPMVEPGLSSVAIYILNGILRMVSRGFIASIFVIAGYYSYTWALSKHKNFSIIELIVGIGFMVINFFLYGINGCVDFHFLVLGNIAVYFPLAIIASLGVVLICKNMCSLRLIEFYGRNSLIIMATHVQCYIIYIGIKVSEPLLGLQGNPSVMSSLFVASVTVIVFIIETVIILIINRFFPFVVGKKRKTISY